MKLDSCLLKERTDIAKTAMMNRRSLLINSLYALGGLVLPDIVRATPAEPRLLTFYHTHTGRHLEVEYTPGSYTRPVKLALEDFLCDFRTGEKHTLDPRLFDSLCAIQDCCGRQASFEVISGYRSPQTNAYLCKTSNGVARKSLHMQGKAIDIRVTELPTKMLRDLALQYHNGGVGYYPKSDFVHLDTGRKRRW